MKPPLTRPAAHKRSPVNLVFVLALALTALRVFGTSDVAGNSMDANLGAPAGGLPALLSIFVLLVVNGLFSAARAAIVALRPVHVRHVRETNPKAADRLQTLIDHKTRSIAAASFGSQLCRFALALSGLMLVEGVAPYTRDSLFLAALTIAVPILLLNLVFEQIPESYAELQPHRVASILSRFIQVANILFALPAWVMTALANLINAKFGAKASFAIANQAEEEIKTIVETAEESGEIESDEKELLHSVFEFTDTVAREVMTPRVDLDAMPLRSEPEAVLQVIEDTGHSRIPLYEGTDDQIVGIIHAKDLLTAMLKSPKTVSLRKIMRPVLFVPENKSLHELLTEMRLARTELAIVQDEFGGTSGIVTTEDIVEELVGEIVDEYDTERPEIETIPEGWLVDGKTHVDDIDEAIGAELESDEFDTIGGYVFGLFGRQPKQGESIEAEGFKFTIAETDGRRILRLQIEKGEPMLDLDPIDAV